MLLANDLINWVIQAALGGSLLVLGIWLVTQHGARIHSVCEKIFGKIARDIIYIAVVLIVIIGCVGASIKISAYFNHDKILISQLNNVDKCVLLEVYRGNRKISASENEIVNQYNEKYRFLFKTVVLKRTIWTLESKGLIKEIDGKNPADAGFHSSYKTTKYGNKIVDALLTDFINELRVSLIENTN